MVPTRTTSPAVMALDPYVLLVITVLRQALDDSHKGGALGAEARAFLASDFTLWAELLGLDGEMVTARLGARA